MSIGAEPYADDQASTGIVTTRLTIALGQMAVVTADPARNLATADRFAATAAAQGADLLILPELWLSGYDLAHAARYVAPELPTQSDGLLPSSMAALAQRYSLAIAGSVLARQSDGQITNMAVVAGPNGRLLASYHKIHLFRQMAEGQYLQAGSVEQARTFPLFWGATALSVCYDLRFPELFRRYMAQGATLVVMPAQWPAARAGHWRTLVQARAIENQCVMVALNRCGTSEGTTFGGGSLICDAWGTILQEMDDQEGLSLTTIDLSSVETVRREFPVLTHCVLGPGAPSHTEREIEALAVGV